MADLVIRTVSRKKAEEINGISIQPMCLGERFGVFARRRRAGFPYRQ